MNEPLLRQGQRYVCKHFVACRTQLSATRRGIATHIFLIMSILGTITIFISIILNKSYSFLHNFGRMHSVKYVEYIFASF